jgi:(hydroxyamino)benzene mutase
MTDGKRRALWHGTMLVLLGLATGGFLPSFDNPRLALAAHVGGIMNGMLIMLIGAVWNDLALSETLARGLFWSLVYSGYVNWLGLVLAAAFGTTSTTPLLGDGTAAEPWQEGLVAFCLVSGAVLTLGAVTIVLFGLHRRAE